MRSPRPRRRRRTFAARATAPLAFADDAVNGVHDRLNAALPWVWWPIGPPSRRRPIPASAHALNALAVVADAVLPELVERAAGREVPTGARRWRRRALAVLRTGVPWLMLAGAWDRRAAGRRPPRLLG